MIRGVAWLVVVLGAGLAHAHGSEPAVEPLAEKPPFELPAPGSYELPPIDEVEQHRLLDESGREARLPGVAGRELAVVSFIYRGCVEAHGCPLALATLRSLDRQLALDPHLGGRVRLITVSFDWRRDTPERMAELRGLMSPRGDWRFLTASGETQLRALLSDYGQSVTQPGPDRIVHVLKVFLVDGERRIRNIYSSGFLSAELLIQDIRTLLLEDPD